jgi:hypothetical protein
MHACQPVPHAPVAGLQHGHGLPHIFRQGASAISHRVPSSIPRHVGGLTHRPASPPQVKFMLASAQLGAPETLTDSEGPPSPSLSSPTTGTPRLTSFSGFAYVFPSSFDKAVSCGAMRLLQTTNAAAGQPQEAAIRSLYALRFNTQRDRLATPAVVTAPCRLITPHPPSPPIPLLFRHPSGIFRDVSASFWVKPLPLIYQPFVRIILTWTSGTAGPRMPGTHAPRLLLSRSPDHCHSHPRFQCYDIVVAVNSVSYSVTHMVDHR